jgi:hypothetical protein
VKVLAGAVLCSLVLVSACSPKSPRVAAPSTPSIASVTFAGTVAAPVVTIRGTGFGNAPPPSPPYAPEGHAACTMPPQGNEGLDYGGQLSLVDARGTWGAGRSAPDGSELDCVGLIVTTYTPTEIVFQLGSAYADHSQLYRLTAGDTFTIGVKGLSYQGAVRYP